MRKMLLANALFLTLVFLPSMGTSFFFDEDYAQIYPDKATLIYNEGDDIILTCTLRDTYPNGLNSSYMYFESDSSSDPLIHTVVSDISIQLRLYNTTYHQKGYYDCCIDETSLVGGNKTWLTYTNVQFRPGKVTSIDCESNNFEDMTCSVCDQGDPDNVYNISWTFPLEEVHHCSVADRCSCFFCGTSDQSHAEEDCRQHDDFSQFVRYQFNITGHNNYGSTSSLMEYEANLNIVNPKRPEFEVIEAMASNLTIDLAEHDLSSWGTVRSNVTMQAIVDYADFPGKLYQSQMIADQSTVTFVDLHPHTKYEISVTSRVEGRIESFGISHWSEATTQIHSTKQDSPRVGPDILNYKKNNCAKQSHNNCQSITIFWKDLAPGDQHGDITSYNIKYCINGDTYIKAVVGDHVSAATVETPAHSECIMSVSACTSLGCSPYSSNFTISHDNLGWPSVVAELSDTSETVELTWLPTTKQDQSEIAIFSCLGQPNNRLNCMGDVSQLWVNASEGHYSMHNRGENYVYGASWADPADGTTAGLLYDWLCIYEECADVGEVAYEKIYGKDYVQVVLLPQGCDEANRGRYINVTLTLCNGNNCRKPVTFDISRREYTFSSLEPDTEYTLDIQGTSNCGKMGPIKSFEFKTIATVPDDNFTEIGVGIGTVFAVCILMALILLIYFKRNPDIWRSVKGKWSILLHIETPERPVERLSSNGIVSSSTYDLIDESKIDRILEAPTPPPRNNQDGCLEPLPLNDEGTSSPTESIVDVDVDSHPPIIIVPDEVDGADRSDVSVSDCGYGRARPVTSSCEHSSDPSQPCSSNFSSLSNQSSNSNGTATTSNVSGWDVKLPDTKKVSILQKNTNNIPLDESTVNFVFDERKLDINQSDLLHRIEEKDYDDIPGYGVPGKHNSIHDSSSGVGSGNSCNSQPLPSLANWANCDEDDDDDNDDEEEETGREERFKHNNDSASKSPGAETDLTPVGAMVFTHPAENVPSHRLQNTDSPKASPDHDELSSNSNSSQTNLLPGGTTGVQLHLLDEDQDRSSIVNKDSTSETSI